MNYRSIVQKCNQYSLWSWSAQKNFNPNSIARSQGVWFWNHQHQKFIDFTPVNISNARFLFFCTFNILLFSKKCSRVKCMKRYAFQFKTPLCFVLNGTTFFFLNLTSTKLGISLNISSLDLKIKRVSP